MCKKPDDSDW